MTYVARTGPYVPNLGNFDTLAELLATHPATLYNPGTTAYAADQGIVVTNGTTWEDVGAGGSTALTAATYAAARLISGVSTGDRLEVLGRTSQSDGGQGLFTWVAGGSTTINDGSQLTAPGGIWQRPDMTIQAQWYGIDPTGVAASDVQLNVAIQDAIIRKMKLVLPSGIFLLNAPLMCFTPGSANQTKIEIEGQGGAVPGTSGFPTIPLSGYQPNTLLCLNSKLVPAIIYQKSRNSVLKNLGIQGQNTQPFFSPAIPTDNTADYILAGCANGAQSPYCGIAIDPFSSALPADGGYSGLSAYYGAGPAGSGSSGITFENVFITEFVVAVGSGTSGVTQGDLMTFRNFHANYCDTVFACGNTQARDNNFLGGDVSWCRQVFDTLNYGAVLGTACNPICIENMNFGELFRIFALNNKSPVTVKGCYAEAIKTLGQFGNDASNARPIDFIGCQFAIADSLWGANKIPPHVFESYSPTIFKGCYLSSDTNNRDVYNFIFSGAGGSFEQCCFTGTSFTDLPPHIAIDWSAASGSHFMDCIVASAPGSYLITDVYNRSSGISSNANGKGRLRATWQTRLVSDANGGPYFYQPPQSLPYTTLVITAASASITTNTLTFTANVSTKFEVLVGDILLWQMLAQGYSPNKWTVPAWKVATVDTGTGVCTATAIYDTAYYDTVANYITKVGGNNVLHQVRHQWAPTTALTGNTHTSTTLDGLSSNSLINGDFVQGVGIPSNTRVVSGGGTASVVLSKAATSTLTGINLYDGQLVAPQTSGVYFPTQAGNTGAAPVPTFALGPLQAWTLSAATTWGVPTGAWVAGNRLTLLVTSTGAFTTAWNAVYRNAPAWIASANAQKATAEFIYDGTNWQFIGGSAAFA